MRKNKFLILFLLLFVCPPLFSQAVLNVVPDTGRQSFSYAFRVNGIGTEWTLSPYFTIDFWGGGVFSDSVRAINDTVILANIYVEPNAPIGFKTVRVNDPFGNSDSLQNAYEVFLWFPATPSLLYPFNNSVNISEVTQMIWDSNATVQYYQLQISTDSLFTGIVYDTNFHTQKINLRSGVLALGQKYFWRVKAYNIIGSSSWSEIWNFRVRTSSIQKISTLIPDKYSLEQNYPNPFNPSTIIRFQLPASDFVKIRIFDMLGREIETLINLKLEAGYYQIKLTINPAVYSSGIYFYMLQTEKLTLTKRMLVLK